MDEIKFSIETPFIELIKLLKLTGLCETGGAAKQAVSESAVKVDGQVETRKRFKVRKGMRVEYENQSVLVE